MLLSSPEILLGDQGLAAVSCKMVAGVSWYGPCDVEKTDLFNHDDRDDFRDRFEAPCEIMIIRNAGHNWPMVDAEIDPSRETIIEPTVQFCIDHL